MNARKIRKIPFHYSTVSLFSTHFSKTTWTTNASYRKRMRRNFFHFICLTCAVLSLSLIFMMKKMFYVTVNKWDVAETILTSRQPGLQIKVYDYRCAYWIPCAVCWCWCFHSPAMLQLMNFTSAKRKDRSILSNGSGPSEMRETPSSCNKFPTLFSN